jgi:hypothetical protein
VLEETQESLVLDTTVQREHDMKVVRAAMVERQLTFANRCLEQQVGGLARAFDETTLSDCLGEAPVPRTAEKEHRRP